MSSTTHTKNMPLNKCYEHEDMGDELEVAHANYNPEPLTLKNPEPPTLITLKNWNDAVRGDDFSGLTYANLREIVKGMYSRSRPKRRKRKDIIEHILAINLKKERVNSLIKSQEEQGYYAFKHMNCFYGCEFSDSDSECDFW